MYLHADSLKIRKIMKLSKIFVESDPKGIKKRSGIEKNLNRES